MFGAEIAGTADSFDYAQDRLFAALSMTFVLGNEDYSNFGIAETAGPSTPPLFHPSEQRRLAGDPGFAAPLRMTDTLPESESPG